VPGLQAQQGAHGDPERHFRGQGCPLPLTGSDRLAWLASRIAAARQLATQRPFQRLVDQLRVGLALGRLHHLVDEPAEDFRVALKLDHLIGVGVDAARPTCGSKIADREEAQHDQGREARGDERQAGLDEVADRRAVPAQEAGHHEEAQAAGQDRGQDEHGQAEMRHAARDGDELVGDRSEALDQDDPQAPAIVRGLVFGDAVGEAVELDDPLADRLEQRVADQIAGEAAHDRGHGRDRGDAPRVVRAGQHHRHDHRIGRDREDRALEERHDPQRAHGVARGRLPHRPVVDPSDHRSSPFPGRVKRARTV
jgi:hypothetical protein